MSVLRGLIALVLLVNFIFGGVSISNEEIKCCEPWDAKIKVIDPDGNNAQNVQVMISVVDATGVKSMAYFYTNNDGLVPIHYLPVMGEAVDIKINESWITYSYKIPVRNDNKLPLETMIMVAVGLAIIVLAYMVFVIFKKSNVIALVSKLMASMNKGTAKKYGPSTSMSSNSMSSNSKSANSKWMFAKSSMKKTVGSTKKRY